MAGMQTAAPVRLRSGLVPWLVGLAAGLLALGPALRPGYLLRLDMVTVPDPPLTTALLGLDPTLPRAVPSDLAAAVLARLVPGDAAVKLLLLAAFTLATAGAARLVPTTRALPAAAGGLCYAWNPWTAERLSTGHWPLLLGYAGLPWVAAAARRLATREPRGAAALGAAMVLPAIGGVSTCILAGTLVIAVLATARVHPRQRPPDMMDFPGAPQAGQRPTGWSPLAASSRVTRRSVPVRAWPAALVAVTAAALPWLLPSLLRRGAVRADPAGVDAFALRPDGPFGPVGTAVQLAGVWDRQAVPGNRSALVVQLAALALVAFAGWGLVRARARIPLYPALLGAGLAGLALAVLPTVEPGAAAARALARLLPASVAMRDSHRWLALLALPIAVGFGAAVDAVADRAAGVAALALLAPLAINPGLAWGLAGTLHPVRYPPEWAAARAAAAADPEPGAVLALPWTPFRDYPRVGPLPVLDPAPRMFDRPVLWNDTVQVGATAVAGESPDAAGLGPLLAGTDPPPGSPSDLPPGPHPGPPPGSLSEPLRARGIRYVLVEPGQPAVDPARLGGTVVVTGPALTLYRLAGPVAPLPPAVRAAALVPVADLTVLVAALGCGLQLLASKLRVREDLSRHN
jgi:hypothetical protein